MRLLELLLTLVAAANATPALAAQAVERTDIPRRGTLRVTLDPRIMTWDRQYTNGTAWRPLGAPLTGDSVGSAGIPTVARLEQDVRTASGLSGFLASLGKGLFSVRQERRTFPITAELGVTRSEEHTSELQSQSNLVCRLLLEKKKKKKAHSLTPIL